MCSWYTSSYSCIHIYMLQINLLFTVLTVFNPFHIINTMKVSCRVSIVIRQALKVWVREQVAISSLINISSMIFGMIFNRNAVAVQFKKRVYRCLTRWSFLPAQEAELAPPAFIDLMWLIIEKFIRLHRHPPYPHQTKLWKHIATVGEPWCTVRSSSGGSVIDCIRFLAGTAADSSTYENIYPPCFFIESSREKSARCFWCCLVLKSTINYSMCLLSSAFH